MPYFTAFSSNGLVNAVYSGRFAFLMPNLYDDLCGQLSEAKKVDEKAESIVREEFKHAQDFLLLPVGLALSGWRWLLRQWYLFSPRTAPVVSYYRLRFFWFCSWYERLESKEQKQNLFIKDISVFFSMFKHFPLGSIALLIGAPLTFPIGYVLNRHFTIFAYASDLGRRVEVGPTSYTSTVFGENRASLLRRVVGYFQRFPTLTTNGSIRINWMRLKFYAEKEMYARFPRLPIEVAPFRDFVQYVNQMTIFSVFWSGNRGLFEANVLANACLNSDNEELWRRLSNDRRSFQVLFDAGEFFFLHGN